MKRSNRNPSQLDPSSVGVLDCRCSPDGSGLFYRQVVGVA